ncbi:type IV pilus assembly protein PilM [Agromyces protaetiae]|uniref:Type IV pilus assembly protein PilM n=1 Tax=Agromyces protaetiae TaxID=2509455 RepID=A0A4V0YH15_9MICO|nr:type IV pilus assembly protein PilM [Agromyces protaetiae]QAY73131.1 type IV pilus assembly protein PilM [Agromyces protaetiae]
MAKSIVGIDIGNSSVRAAEIGGTQKGKPVLTHYAEVLLPEGAVVGGEVKESNTVATAVRTLWQRGGFTTRDVVLGVGNEKVLARDFTVRKATMAQIRDSLPFEARDVLPMAVTDAVLDFSPTAEAMSEHGPVLKGLLIAAPKDAVLGNVRTVQGAGLKATDVDLIPFALTRAIVTRPGITGTVAVVDIGAETTTTVVVREGVPQFIRIVPTGGNRVTAELLSGLDADPPAAEALKRDLGLRLVDAETPDGREAVGLIASVVREQLASVRNTIAYYQSTRPDEPVTRVLLSGGGAQLKGLAGALSDLARLPVEHVDPLAGVALGRRLERKGLLGDPRHMAVAVGLALGSAA